MSIVNLNPEIQRLMQASLEEKQAALAGMNPKVEPYKLLAALNNQIRNTQLSAAQQQNQAMQAGRQVQQEPPIAEELLSQLPENQGIAVDTPVQMAGGGIVSFAEGGETDKSILGDALIQHTFPGLVYRLYDSLLNRKRKDDKKDKEESLNETRPDPTRVRQEEAPEIPTTPEFLKAFKKESGDGAGVRFPNIKLPEVKYETPSYQKRKTPTADEMDADSKKRTQKNMEGYDAQMQEFVEYENEQLRKAQERRTPKENLLRAIVQAKDLGRGKLGSSIAGIAAKRYEIEDEEKEAQAKAMNAAMQAKRLRVEARIAANLGYEQRAQQLLARATELENQGIAESNRQEETSVGVRNKEVDARQRQAEFEANKKMQEAQINATLQAATLRAGSSGSSLGGVKPAQLMEVLNKAERAAETEVNNALKNNPKLKIETMRNPALVAQLKERAKFEAAVQQIAVLPGVDRKDAEAMIREVMAIGTTPKPTGPQPRTIDFNSIK